MEVVENLLKKTSVPYVVAGGRSYLAIIPDTTLTLLTSLLSNKQSSFFDKSSSDWNIYVQDAKSFNSLIIELQSALKNNAVVYKQVISKEPVYKAMFYSSLKKKIPFATIVDESKSKKGGQDAGCNGATHRQDNITYIGLCDVLAKMKKALLAKDFKKKAKVQARLHVILNTLTPHHHTMIKNNAFLKSLVDDLRKELGKHTLKFA